MLIVHVIITFGIIFASGYYYAEYRDTRHHDHLLFTWLYGIIGVYSFLSIIGRVAVS